MAIFGATTQEYDDFIEKGGELHLILEKGDVGKNGDFEHFKSLQEQLETGFELAPTTSMYDPKAFAELLVHGDQWTRTIASVYSRGGKIIYRRLPDGRYEAKLTIPS